jgi:hypothetical protein
MTFRLIFAFGLGVAILPAIPQCAARHLWQASQ